MPTPYRSVLAVEGVETSDRRIINPNALGWRTLPLSLMAIIENSHGGMPTTTSVNVGRIDTIEREAAPDLGDDVFRLVATGVFDDDDDPVAATVARKVGGKMLRGVSIDVGDVESEFEVLEEDEDGWPIDWLDRLVAGSIMAATVCAMPAFADAYIELLEDAPAGDDAPVLVASGAAEPWRVVPQQPRVASLVAGAGPLAPPAEWFTDPQLAELTPLTILDDGRVFGHLAPWDEDHRGIPGAAAPRDSDPTFPHFHLGAVRTAEGRDLPVGGLTIGTGHAPTRGISAHAAAEHYDNSGTRWADVRAGTDEHGIWVAGAVLPDVDEVTLRRARALPLSGDWRRFREGAPLELIAALSVNVPGFRIPRPVLVASMGEPVALVAAGVAVLAGRTRAAAGSSDSAVEAAVRRVMAPVLNRHLRDELRARMLGR